MIHKTEIKVRGYHINFYGHVNNARYLEFLEEARWEACAKRIDLKAMSQEGQAFTVVNVNINFRRPAVMEDTLIIESEVTQFRRRSALFHQVIKIKGTDTVVVDADVTFLIFDQNSQKTAIMEGELLARLQTLCSPETPLA